jgi:hypothetical protein
MAQLDNGKRKAIEAKLLTVFEESIIGLSPKLREILIDDMVTAFENRLNMLNCVTQKA